MLIGGKAPEDVLTLQTNNPPEMLSEMIPQGVNPWLEIIESILFWTVFLLVVGFSFYQFYRQNAGIQSDLLCYPGLKILPRIWNWFQGILKGLNQNLSGIVQSSLLRIQT